MSAFHLIYLLACCCYWVGFFFLFILFLSFASLWCFMIMFWITVYIFFSRFLLLLHNFILLSSIFIILKCKGEKKNSYILSFCSHRNYSFMLFHFVLIGAHQNAKQTETQTNKTKANKNKKKREENDDFSSNISSVQMTKTFKEFLYFILINCVFHSSSSLF